jgi:hypothetical protein
VTERQQVPTISPAGTYAFVLRADLEALDLGPRSSVWCNSRCGALFGSGFFDDLDCIGVASDDMCELLAGESPKSFLVQHEFEW